MRFTIIGCGDAFGSGGRFNTCFLLEAEGRTLAVDFGASSLVALKRLRFNPNDIDAILLSHLHGDHFGGLPFLLLDSQFDCRRDKPLTIVGPPGTKGRLDALMEAMFPGSSRNKWRFPLLVEEMECGAPRDLAGFQIESREVTHPSGAPSTGVRVSAGEKLFAFSGDTGWTETLVDLARGANLFVLECYGREGPVPHHLDFGTVEANRARLEAEKVMLTHLGPVMLAHLSEAEEKGYLIAHDGLVLDL